MAIYSFTIRIISRSKTNPVDALAYRAGTKVVCSRTGETFDRSSKEVQHVELLLPDGAPLWAKNLQRLIAGERPKGVQEFCHRVENAEKRKDAQIYREFRLTLPLEFTQEQSITLTREYVQDQACKLGMTALLNFHFDEDLETGKANPHCHVLLLTRCLTKEGLAVKKDRTWNKKSQHETWREQWAAYLNFHLKLNGFDVTVDHRSYAEQGIDLEPQPKLGQNIRQMEKRAGLSHRNQTGKEVDHKEKTNPFSPDSSALDKCVQFTSTSIRNTGRIIQKPERVFEIVTKHQSTFMWGDVEKVLSKYIHEDALFHRLNAKLKASKELIFLRDVQQMTLEGNLEDHSVYTTRTLLQKELDLVRLAESLSTQQSHPVKTEEIEKALKQTDQKFKAQGGLSDDQKEALRHLTKGDRLSCIVGYAGAGKSAILEAAKEAWEASGYRVYGLSPFGKAAENLEQRGIPSQTLHKFLKNYHNGRSSYHAKSVLVLDEAGSVDVTRFQAFLSAVEHLGVKAVVVGDGAQTQPIEAGAAFRLVTSRMGLRKIESVVRQKEAWQREASRLFGTYETRKALKLYQDRGHVQFVDEKVPDLKGLIMQGKHREIVECYNLSRRLCGNIYHNIAEEAESRNLSPQETFVFLKKHQDYALFKQWQTLRRSASDSMLSHLEDCRPLMKELGVDPLKFSQQFVQRDRDASSQNRQASQLVKFWNLPTPDPQTLPHQCDVRAETKKEMVRQWTASLKEFPHQSHVMLTYTNRDTASLNQEARHLMKQNRVVSLEEYVCTIRREDEDDFGRIVVTEEQKPFAKGDQIVFTRNDNSLNVKNGTLGTIEGINHQKVRVKLEGEDRHVSFAPKLYPYFDYGWAVTIIKSQGITADRVFKLATYEENRNLAYVGMTRHHLSLKVLGSKLDFWRDDIFLDRLSSSKEKLLGLDYISQEEAAKRLQHSHSKVVQALEKLRHQMDAIGFISRKGWERIAERFVGQTPREESIQIPQNSLEEAQRARLLGIHPDKENTTPKLAVVPEARKLLPKTFSIPSEIDDVWIASALSEPRNDGNTRHREPHQGRGDPDLSKDDPYKTEATAVFHPEPVAPAPQTFSPKQTIPKGFQKLDRRTSGESRTAYIKYVNRANSEVQRLQLLKGKGDMKKPQRRFVPIPQPLYRVKDVRRNLTSYSVEYLCTHLLGNPNPHLSNKRQLRYGKSGSLAITLTGKKVGMWRDFERGEGGDLFQLVQRERGGEFKEALAYVAEALRMSPERPLPRPTLSQKDDNALKEERRRQKAQKLCTATTPLQGTLAETYLRKHRGIRGTLPPDLQFIKSHYNYIAGKSFPALAALARDKTGKVTGVQLVYLDRWTGQKAKADLTKQSVGSFIGSPVQIQKGTGALFLAEGVETALSLKEAGLRGDIYATLSVSNIQGVGDFLQEKSRPLVICADADAEHSPARKTVEEAVSFLKERGFAVSVIRPEHSKGDFNDILRKEGISGVQAYFREYLGHSPQWEEEFKKQYLAAHPERAMQKKTTPSQSTPLTPPQIIGKFKFLTEQINTLENKGIIERLTKERNNLVASILQDNTLMTRIRLRDSSVATQIAALADSLKKQQEKGKTSGFPENNYNLER